MPKRNLVIKPSKIHRQKMLYPDLCRIFRAGFGYTIRFWIHGLFDEFLNIFIFFIFTFFTFLVICFRGSGLTMPWGDDLQVGPPARFLTAAICFFIRRMNPDARIPHDLPSELTTYIPLH